MKKGYLHLDLRYGIDAFAINGALSALIGHEEQASLLENVEMALAQKISALFPKDYQLPKECLSLFVKLINKLDPQYVSSTPIFISPSSMHSLDFFTKQMLIGIPVVETDDAFFNIDPLGLAFIKAVSGHFGARGNLVISKVVRGYSLNDKDSFVEASFCHNEYPISIAEREPFLKMAKNPKQKICALIPPQINIYELSKSLSLLGGKSIAFNLVQTKESLNRYEISLICDFLKKNAIIEELLINGQAQEVDVQACELYSLKKRLVSIPLGSKNKIISFKFHEYLYGDRILRAEPTLEDLARYIQITNYTHDMALKDLMGAWKKYRSHLNENFLNNSDSHERDF